MPTLERFWEQVDRRGDSDCWPWTGLMRGGGYGDFYIGVDLAKRLGIGGGMGAYRASYIIHFGPIGPGLVVDHKCHNRACVNPRHLQTVTRQQNNENQLGPRSGTRSGVKGVSWDSYKNRWRAVVVHSGKQYDAGRHRTIEAARAAYEAKARILHTNNLEIMA